jgi:pyruvate/2-oxoglutarate/acetoin dehydrogenase E1 component
MVTDGSPGIPRDALGTKLEVREITLCDAIREAYQEEMRRDDRIVMFGTSIQAPTFPHTKGLAEEFGEGRVLDTPIAEPAMTGCAMGAAQEGLRPIVDYMYAGFSYYAASEAFIQTGQYYFVHGSQLSLPMVMVGTCGVGRRVGNEHSMLPYGSLIHLPGVKVCMPSTAYDAKGLMKAAIRDNNPVFFLWHTSMMMQKGPVPSEDYIVPLGLADIKRAGTDVTVLASGFQVGNALKVAEALSKEVSVEVIDPRSFEPFDRETLLRSLAKTGRLVVVDEDFERGGFAAEVLAQVMEHGYNLLDAPVKRVCHPHFPIPGGYIDVYTMPTRERIEAAIREVLA